jgi:hypothetical protein
MAKLNRSTTIGFLVSSVLVLAAASWAPIAPGHYRADRQNVTFRDVRGSDNPAQFLNKPAE